MFELGYVSVDASVLLSNDWTQRFGWKKKRELLIYTPFIKRSQFGLSLVEVQFNYFFYIIYIRVLMILYKLHFCGISCQQRSLTAQLSISSSFLQVDIKWHQAMDHLSRRPLCCWISSMLADSVWMTSWKMLQRVCRYVGSDHCPGPFCVLAWLSRYFVAEHGYSA